MAKIRWNIAASIGLIVLSQAASAEPGSRVAMVAGNSADRNLSQHRDPNSDADLVAAISGDFGITVNDRGVRLDVDKAAVLAQAGEPAASAPTPPQGSKAPPDQSPPAVSSPPAAVSTSEVARPAPSGPGCALRYMAAELAGKLKGRKWKQFHQEECGASNALVVFPTMIAPKIRRRTAGQGAHTYVCGSIHRQQGDQWKRWPEMDRKERRRLQRVRRPLERLSLSRLSAARRRRLPDRAERPGVWQAGAAG